MPMSPLVAAAFDAFASDTRTQLEEVRALIFEIASETDGVGPITETLKWGEPAYLTAASKSGSTIRLGVPRGRPDCVAVYFNCKTTLIANLRDMLPDQFTFEGNRALLIRLGPSLDRAALAIAIRMALTYHKAKAG